MKLVIGGSTGFVGTELIRQALENPAVTSIVALGRRAVSAPPAAGASAAKLNSVVVDDLDSYSDSVKKMLQDADACIWTIAVTPMNLQNVSWEETCRVSRDHATTAVKTLGGLRSKQDGPLRFVYMSGHFAPRSATEVPNGMENNPFTKYGLLRGEAEALILAYAEQSEGAIQACVAKPGLIDHPSRERMEILGLPHIELTDISAALLDQVINGFEKDTLSNDDMVRIGQKALAAQRKP